MGKHYESLAEMKRLFPFFHSVSVMQEFNLFIIGDDERKRLSACQFTKEVIEEKLKRSKNSGDIKEYEVKIIDLSGQPSPIDTIDWKRMGNLNDAVFVPIFHNADRHVNLAQMAFDKKLPAFFSVTSDGYNQVTNYSKRDFYDTVRV